MNLTSSCFSLARRALLAHASTLLAAKLSAVLTLGFVLTAASANAATVESLPTIVAVSGTQSPAGTNYEWFGPVAVSSTGQLIFVAGVDDGQGTQGLFTGTAGNMQTAVIGNTNYQGVGTMGSFKGFVLNTSGQLAFEANTAIPYASGVYLQTTGTIQRVAQTNTNSPAGGNYSNFGYNTLTLNNAGQLAYWADVQHSPSNYDGIFRQTAGVVNAVALQGDAAPGGGFFEDFNPNVSLNSAGQVAFFSSLANSGPAGLYVGVPGSIQAVAVEGTMSPAGSNFGYVNNFKMNDAGQILVSSSLNNPAAGLFAGKPGALQTVALSGTAAPAGGLYGSYFSGLALNQAGQIAFSAPLSGGTANSGIFAGTPDVLQAVAIAGSASPVGGMYDYMSDPMLNNAGQLAFVAYLTGPDMTYENNAVLLAGTPGALVPIVRLGDSIDVDPSADVDMRTVNGINFLYSSGEGGRATAFNDQGLLVYSVSFTNNTYAIMTTQLTAVPEPGTIGVVAAGALGFWMWRRKRAKAGV